MTPLARWRAGGTAAIILLGVGSLSWIIANRDPSGVRVARGQAVYAQNCASCHGANLEGQPNWRARLPSGRLPAPPHDLTGHTWHHSDKQLFGLVKDGVAGIAPGYQTDMPAYQGVLSDPDIWAVLSFIESTWPPHIRERQQRLDRGRD